MEGRLDIADAPAAQLGRLGAAQERHREAGDLPFRDDFGDERIELR
jgi:hypothetical protein